MARDGRGVHAAYAAGDGRGGHAAGAASRPEPTERVMAVCGFSKAMRKYGHEKTVNNSGNDFDVERFSGGEREGARP